MPYPNSKKESGGMPPDIQPAVLALIKDIRGGFSGGSCRKLKNLPS